MPTRSEFNIEPLRKILSAALEEAGINPTSFSRISKINQSTLSQLLNKDDAPMLDRINLHKLLNAIWDITRLPSFQYTVRDIEILCYPEIGLYEWEKEAYRNLVVKKGGQRKLSNLLKVALTRDDNNLEVLTVKQIESWINQESIPSLEDLNIIAKELTIINHTKRLNVYDLRNILYEEEYESNLQVDQSIDLTELYEALLCEIEMDRLSDIINKKIIPSDHELAMIKMGYKFLGKEFNDQSRQTSDNTLKRVSCTMR